MDNVDKNGQHGQEWALWSKLYQNKKLTAPMLRFILLFCCLVCPLQGAIHSVRDELIQAAETTGSDAILILRDGKPIFQYKTSEVSQRYNLGEMTGMFWGFAIGSLIDANRLSCLDVPVLNFIPSFKAKTSLRALLNHTSGLPRSEDLRLLQELIAKISGKSARDYVSETFLTPLGVSDYSWVTVSGSDSLMLSAEDLAKVGQLLLNQGQWQCKRIITPYWLGILKTPSQQNNPFYGQQIWLEYCDLGVYWDEPLLKFYRKNGIAASLVNKLARIGCREIHFGGSVVQGHILRLWGRDLVPDYFGIVDVIMETYFKNLPLGKFTPGCVKSLIGWGGNGQQLIVMPEERFVGVRLSTQSKNVFTDFIYYVDALTKEYHHWVD